MGNLPQIGQTVAIPTTLSTPGYLMDHHFQGKPVFPAVEAMATLARAVKEACPDLRVDRLTDVGFDKFLFMAETDLQLEATVELSALENGKVRATLLTRTKAPRAAFTRTKTHVRLTVDPKAPAPTAWPKEMAAALEGVCITVPPERIYEDLVPFGPTFRNIRSPLKISPHGALAHIHTPGPAHHGTGCPDLLGSGYALDAAFHAACVWAQHYKNIVAFPVGVQRRTVFRPISSDQTCVGRVIPTSVTDTLLTFDILLLDEKGRIREVAEGVHMRDVSGGRLVPPRWIMPEEMTDPLESIKTSCRDMAIVELDAVTGFSHQAFTPLEKERHAKMGDRRSRSFTAARMALKTLYRRHTEDQATPADRIDTVYENSPLPCMGPLDPSDKRNCSVSHDRRFAIAVAHNSPVGVDVEEISPRALKADRIFTNPAEQKLMRQSSMDDSAAAVRIWSIKEAAAKATGINLAETWGRSEVTAVGERRSEVKVDGRILTARHATVDEHLFTLLALS